MSMFVKRAMLAVLPRGLSACGGGVEFMSRRCSWDKPMTTKQLTVDLTQNH